MPSRTTGPRYAAGQIALTLACGCGAAAPVPASTRATAAPQSAVVSAVQPAAELRSNATFTADLTAREVGAPFNVFGAQNGNRRATGGPKGLWLEIVAAEKSWDAVGVRTAKVQVEGDFDLRGAFRDFGASGDASTKLIVIDAASTRGEAAYVERLRIDGKDLFKFGGEVEGSLENWGFVAASVNAGELRLARRGSELHAYQRAGSNDAWSEFAPAQPAPKSMPRSLKVGVKLSAQTGRSAEVTWTALAVEGHIVRLP